MDAVSPGPPVPPEAWGSPWTAQPWRGPPGHLHPATEGTLAQEGPGLVTVTGQATREMADTGDVGLAAEGEPLGEGWGWGAEQAMMSPVSCHGPPTPLGTRGDEPLRAGKAFRVLRGAPLPVAPRPRSSWLPAHLTP